MMTKQKFFFVCTFVFFVVLAAGSPVRVLAQSQADAAKPAATQPASSEAEQPEKDGNDAYRHSPTVTKLGAMIGMNSERAATAFTLSNLLILIVALGYLLMKNLPTTFKNRNSVIKKQLVDARTATQEAQSRLSSVEQRLSRLDEQIASMRAQSEMDAEREEQRIKALAADEKARILAAAELEIQNATSLARREIQGYAAELAIEQASRKLVVTSDMDRLLVENFAGRLSSSERGNN